MLRFTKSAGLLVLLSSVVSLVYWQYTSDASVVEPTIEAEAETLSIAETIARLYRLYSVFTEEDQRAHLSLPERKAVELEFQQLIANVPFNLLLAQMEKYEVAHAAQIEQYKQPQQFVQRLVKIVMNGIITPLEAELPQHGDVLFSQNLGQLPTSYFDARQQAVVARFDSRGYQQSHVLVKWYESNSGEIVLFKQFPIDLASSNYVWIHNEKGLRPGDYRVEIFRVSEFLELLSSGNYRVVAI